MLQDPLQTLRGEVGRLQAGGHGHLLLPDGQAPGAVRPLGPHGRGAVLRAGGLRAARPPQVLHRRLGAARAGALRGASARLLQGQAVVALLLLLPLLVGHDGQLGGAPLQLALVLDGVGQGLGEVRQADDRCEDTG